MPFTIWIQKAIQLSEIDDSPAKKAELSALPFFTQSWEFRKSCYFHKKQEKFNILDKSKSAPKAESQR